MDELPSVFRASPISSVALDGVPKSSSGTREHEFADLLQCHDREILRYIMTFIPRRDDAEEVLQRTAVVLWEKFADYDPDRAFLPWAFRFAYFEVLGFRKQLARDRLIFNEEILASLAETRRSQESELDRRREALRLCMQALKAGDMTLLQRRYNDSATVASLAQLNGRSAKSMYRRLDRIRELLIHCVEQRLARELRMQ